MSIYRWSNLEVDIRARILTQNFASLWILPGATTSDVSAIKDIPWVNIWNNNPAIDVSAILESATPRREIITVKSSDDDVVDFSTKKFVRLYNSEPSANKNFKGLPEFKAMQLKSRVATAAGIIVFAGPIDQSTQDILFISDLAPHLHLVGFDDKFSSLPTTTVDLYLFQDTHAFSTVFGPRLEHPDSTLVNLKDTDNLHVSDELLESITQNWTFLTAAKISQKVITQDNFDSFISGDAIWQVYSSGGAYQRQLQNSLSEWNEGGAKSEFNSLTDIILKTAREIEAVKTDPRAPLRQIRLFSEQASGTTTVLRQAAVDVSRAGYPVLISNPSTRTLSTQTVVRFIIDTQDRWREGRSGRGSGRGNIPFILFVDNDLDEEIEHHRLSRALAILGREVLLIRAFERSREEIARATDVLCLRADVSEEEMLKIGGHLREFSTRNGLASIPSDDEWRSYHKGLNYIARYDPAGRFNSAYEEIPHLFLVGISPFISERTHDLNGLQQYYYQKWDALNDLGLKHFVSIVAAVGSFGISVPYDSLRRVEEIDLGALEKLSAPASRNLDLFVHWHQEGWDTRSWYLRIRHPIVGRLLSRTIDPIEGDVPYKPLIPLLRKLTTKDDDIWFAQSLVSRIGKYFKRRAQSFSLESDTPIQRAARAIFSAVPQIVKDKNRTIVHHEARYHMHVLHACLDALAKPLTTTLKPKAVRKILEDEFQSAEKMLEAALAIDDASEPDRYILNTYAALEFNLADSIDEKSSKAFADQFAKGLDLQEEAIGFDAIEALTRHQFVHEIFTNVPNGAWSDDEKLELYSRAEIRMQELLDIVREKTIKNADPVESEVQVALLFELYRNAISKFKNYPAKLGDFTIRHPEAGIALAVRRVLATKSLHEGFLDQNIVTELRKLRSELDAVPKTSARSLLLLYRLFLSDPLARTNYEKRLNILAALKRLSYEQYLPYWHDEAALLCQLDNLQRGTERFAELRAFRRAQRTNQVSQWFWTNERALLEKDGSPRLRKMAVTITNPKSGHATFKGTNVTTRFQTYQFPELKEGQVILEYVRFTFAGTQVVPESLAKADIEAMGLS